MNESEAASARDGGLSAHPGWFGWDYSGGSGRFILAMHADWPAYPCEPGPGHALFDLAQFPRGTQFEPISDIDRCVLFSAVNYDTKKPGRPKDPWSRDEYQVAVWHEDLIYLQQQGVINGVTPISEREWMLRQRIGAGWTWGRKLYTKDDEGNFHECDWPRLPEAPCEEDFFADDPYEYPAFEHDGIDSPVTITDAGWEVVTRELGAAIALPETLPDLQKQLDQQLYDSAIREVGIAIEAALRDALGTDDGYGQKLVNDFVAHLKDEIFVLNTALKIYRLRLRTFFKFVRNPHAHHKIQLTQPHALALIAHALDLLSDIQQLSARPEP